MSFLLLNDIRWVYYKKTYDFLKQNLIELIQFGQNKINENRPTIKIS